MRVVVLTGGIGAGKSTAAEHLREKGAVVIDADEVAAELLGVGSPVLARVVEAFGDDVLLADGRLDRVALARAAFATREGTRRLDALVHPAVITECARRIATLRASAEPPAVALLEVPLLAEAPQARELADIVVALVAPEATRIERAMARGMSEDDARRRLRVQAADAERVALADVVVVNDGSREHLFGELDRLWDERLAEERAR